MKDGVVIVNTAAEKSWIQMHYIMLLNQAK